MLLPLGREILPEHPDICSGMNAASESATLFMEARRRSDRLRAAMGCDHVPGVSRAVPHHGERPCRTRRLRFHLSKGIRHGRIPIWSGTSREILPPDASGTDRIKLSSGGLGGGGQCLTDPCSAVANTLKFSMSRLSLSLRQPDVSCCPAVLLREDSFFRE